MSNRLTVVIECSPVLDPRRDDPREAAENVVLIYNEWAEANGIDPVSVVYAEWGHRVQETPR